jgi:hypothetical protein
LAYLLTLTIAVLSPAIWAARGRAVWPGWWCSLPVARRPFQRGPVIDRGDSVGFIAPIGLVFLVALCRRRWAIVAFTVVLAALVKPQFAFLAVVLFAARLWRLAASRGRGGDIERRRVSAVEELSADDRAIDPNLVAQGASIMGTVEEHWNVSFETGLLLLPDYIAGLNAGGRVPRAPSRDLGC